MHPILSNEQHVDRIQTSAIQRGAETVILIRNIGKLRLGLFVAITKSGVKIEENWSEFEQSTYLDTMLGHVDKLVEIVVNYE
jgi:hypothetical protein